MKSKLKLATNKVNFASKCLSLLYCV